MQARWRWLLVSFLACLAVFTSSVGRTSVAFSRPEATNTVQPRVYDRPAGLPAMAAVEQACIWRGYHQLTRLSTSNHPSPPGILATEGETGLIFRGGSQTDNALTDKGTGLSFRDSLSNPADQGQAVLRPGEKYFGVDTSKLPPGSVVRDNVPPGHVSVNGLTPDQIRAGIVDPQGDPFLGGRFPK